MKYRILYESKYRNDVLDHHQDINCRSNSAAKNAAKKLIDGLNEKSEREDARKSFQLTGVSRVIVKFVRIRSEILRSIL